MTITDVREPTGEWAVETHGLTKRFGPNTAVDGVELLVPRGCAFGYLGPNGAGKTTLIRVLLGLTRADAGTMSLLGHEVPKHRDRALARVGAIVDEPRFHAHLTGRQNLQVLASVRERAAKGRVEESLDRVGLSHRADDRVSKYSMGMRQRLGVAACLIGDPQLLVLDEPMNGLDPAGMQDMREMILSLVAEGRTVMLSSHLLDEVERTCDAVAIVDRGRVIRQGPITDLLATTTVEVHVECSEPARAQALLANTVLGQQVQVHPDGLAVTLPAGTQRDAIAEIARLLVGGGIQLYRLEEVRASLESWFLEVTKRLDTGMTATIDPTENADTVGPVSDPADHRGSPIPTFGMIATRFMELRKRRGLMATLILVTIGIPAVFLLIRLILHAVAPDTYGPAGGYTIYVAMVSGVLYVFGFIVAAALGASAGSLDLTEGMFRHEVVTGRSRLALYLARIPAGLAIILPLVAIGFTIVCVVCVFAAPTRLDINGVKVPANLSRPTLQSWAADNSTEVICNFDIRIGGPNDPLGQVLESVPCRGDNRGIKAAPGSQPIKATKAQVRQAARLIAAANYGDYSRQFLYPSTSLMIKSGLWIELEALIGFTVALGLGSLIGQRTVTVILMIVLEVVLTPIFSRAHIPHFSNLQRSVVGLATAHLAPGSLPVLGGGGGGHDGSVNNELLPESIRVAVIVVIAWIVGWTILGAWRMMTRDA